MTLRFSSSVSACLNLPGSSASSSSSLSQLSWLISLSARRFAMASYRRENPNAVCGDRCRLGPPCRSESLQPLLAERVEKQKHHP
uniref:Putative secreted protein n=1 Tax=Ixodes ricinus TaxID=34613 RepID=A0A6B0U858_IXORI